MILNSYAILLAFVGSLRLVLAVLVIGLGLAGWLRRGRAGLPEGREALETRGYLVFSLAGLLVGLNFMSWPLLYLLLQSYVPHWAGVMCIYGVTKIGEGSPGPARHLPALIQALQLTKPLLVFVGGAWFVLYLLNRRTPSGPLLGRLFIALLPFGLLAAADATAELTYVAIPKKEEFAASGCCTGRDPGIERYLPQSWVGDAGQPPMYFFYYGTNIALIVGLLLATRRKYAKLGGAIDLAVLALGGAYALHVTGAFLVEVAAPAILKLPYHRCAYDLVPRAPDVLAAFALHLAGGYFLGWALVARLFGRSAETETVLPATIRGLLSLSLWSYVASLLMQSLELALA